MRTSDSVQQASTRLAPVQTERAPAAIGPYSQGMRWEGLVFASGQLPLGADGSLVSDDVSVQTRQALANLAAVLEAGGAGLDTVLKTTVFVKNLGSFAAINAVYADCFGAHKPARSTVEVARLPRDVLVEVEAIAYRRG